jgi:hypothetical protein
VVTIALWRCQTRDTWSVGDSTVHFAAHGWPLICVWTVDRHPPYWATGVSTHAETWHRVPLIFDILVSVALLGCVALASIVLTKDDFAAMNRSGVAVIYFLVVAAYLLVGEVSLVEWHAGLTRANINRRETTLYLQPVIAWPLVLATFCTYTPFAMMRRARVFGGARVQQDEARRVIDGKRLCEPQGLLLAAFVCGMAASMTAVWPQYRANSDIALDGLTIAFIWTLAAKAFGASRHRLFWRVWSTTIIALFAASFLMIKRFAPGWSWLGHVSDFPFAWVLTRACLILFAVGLWRPRFGYQAIRWQFSIRTMLIVTAVLALIFAILS